MVATGLLPSPKGNGFSLSVTPTPAFDGPVSRPETTVALPNTTAVGFAAIERGDPPPPGGLCPGLWSAATVAGSTIASSPAIETAVRSLMGLSSSFDAETP